ncbi:MAG: late competence development ComFB family protein [Deltaproteobacteria bacterium]|nr:late competence development ComFB family protein [Deltaproteobacteria bacterium]
MKNNNYLINGICLENVRNGYELVVIELMKKLIPEYSEFDNCPICIEDVYALSLSRIPATYFRKDSPLSLDANPDENVEEIVRYALFQVMNQPNHK